MRFRLTLLCMEPSRPAVIAGVADALVRELPGVELVVRAHATGELHDDARPAAIASDVAASDVVVVSHVLLDEEVAHVAAMLEGLPAACSVIVVSSARELMRLTRLGRFSMARKDSSAARERGETRRGGALGALLARIRKGRDITPFLKELMVLAPKLLRLVPGRMQDVRSYLECHLALIECTPANLRSMILMLADRYGDQTRGAFRDRYREPVVHPETGIYHPDAPGLFASRREYLAWYGARGDRGVVGLILLRSDIMTGETTHYDATIRAIEARGLGVVAAFSGSFDYRTAVERMMLDANGRGIDALVSLTAFPLVGGHARCDTESSVAALSRYDVPYLAPIPLLFQTVDAWRANPQGLDPMQTAMHVALPELDGAIEPIVTSGVVDGPNGQVKVALPERVERLAARLDRWIALRRTPVAEKRIAVTLFAFPPNRGAVGTAAYLDVIESLYNTLRRLRDEGYHVELPASRDELLRDLIGTVDPVTYESAQIAVAARLRVDEYHAIAPEADLVAKKWGPPPGALNTNGRELLVHGRAYGNVFVGIQPSFGYDGDPMRLLFARGATPHHGFVAYYRWIERVWRADAHLHFGTHGALEFMPGKQVGLDATCWPDALIGELPNVYLYSLNNPSEGTIARRRSLATLVSYLTPPLEHAGLYRELATLKGMIAEYRELDASRRAGLVAILAEKVDALHLDRDVPPPFDERDHDRFVGRLHAHLEEIESRLIPNGLHVVGERPSRTDLADMLLAIAEYDRPDQRIVSLAELVAVARDGASFRAMSVEAERGDAESLERCQGVLRTMRAAIEAMLDAGVDAGLRALVRECPRVAARDARRTLAYLDEVAHRACDERELDAIVRALGGRYIEPAIGSDPVRRPEALPSGRNIHGLDPASVPSEAAVRNARRVVDAMLAKCVEESGAMPRSVGLVLWGLDNIKTHGEAIAQAFVLLGVEPERNSIGRVSRLRVVPLEELGRARIDVTIQASGIFRDIFGAQIELIDDAVRLVASLDEPEELNHVRARSGEMQRELGLDERDAATRVFSNDAGAYGTHLDHMVSMSSWTTSDDLVEMFLKRKTFAYGRRTGARESREIFEALAARIDVTVQNLDSSEVGITDVDHYFEYIGGMTAVVERASGRRPLALVADTTTARAKVRTLVATIRLEARTKLLNPRWIAGMMRHGYQGVEEIRKRLDYTFGFAATCDAVDDWVFDEAHAAFVDDDALAARMRELNPDAYAGLVKRLIEAAERGLWQTALERVGELRERAASIEDELEGVVG
jgi:magnesium chelatase subunit H